MSINERSEKSSIADAGLIKLHDWDHWNQQQQKIYSTGMLLIFFLRSQRSFFLSLLCSEWWRQGAYKRGWKTRESFHVPPPILIFLIFQQGRKCAVQANWKWAYAKVFVFEFWKNSFQKWKHTYHEAGKKGEGRVRKWRNTLYWDVLLRKV